MNKTDVLSIIESTGVVAVIRMNDSRQLFNVIEAVRLGGVKCIEITMTVPGAVEIIRRLQSEIPPGIVLGAGTVIDKESAQSVILAGAKFVVSPIFNPEVLEVCKLNQIVCVPGCLSPSEILSGWKSGADIIKVFPATSLGPRYLRDLMGPFPDIKLMPSGGVTINNVGEWIEAGAVAVGIGTNLLDKKAIEEGRFEVLTERARRMIENIYNAKSKLK